MSLFNGYKFSVVKAFVKAKRAVTLCPLLYVVTNYFERLLNFDETLQLYNTTCINLVIRAKLCLPLVKR